MQVKMNYPKILIVGQYFNTTSGGGITMTNLFKDWKKENIAVAAQDIYNPNFEVCNKYYRLGSLEIKRRFPFNLNPWAKPIKSGIINGPKIFGESSTNTVKNSLLKKIYLSLLHFTGLYHYKSRYTISNHFLKWVKEYSPDIIYSQLSTIELTIPCGAVLFVGVVVCALATTAIIPTPDARAPAPNNIAPNLFFIILILFNLRMTNTR